MGCYCPLLRLFSQCRRQSVVSLSSDARGDQGCSRGTYDSLALLQLWVSFEYVGMYLDVQKGNDWLVSFVS